jgi:hypothetical protein
MAWQASKLHYSLLHIPTYSSSPYEMHGYVEQEVSQQVFVAKNISRTSP